jgi:YVTN family beta-propeller protein
MRISTLALRAPRRPAASRWLRPLAVFAAAGIAVTSLASPALAGPPATTTIAVGTHPWGIAADSVSRTVYVTNEVSDTVSVISEATNTVIKTIAVGDAPQGVAVDPNTNTVWVDNDGSGTVSVISAATNTVIQTVPVDVNGVNEGPNTIVVDAPTHTVYVGLYQGFIMAVSDQNYAAHVVYTSNSASHISVWAVEPSTNTLLAITQDTDQFVWIDTTTNAWKYKYQWPNLPSCAAIELNANGTPGHVFLGQFNYGYVWIYPEGSTGLPNGGAPTDVYTDTAGVVAIGVDASRDTAFFVENSNGAPGAGTVLIISGASTANPQIAAAVAVGTNPGELTVDPGDGPAGTVFVVNSGSNTVTAFAE